MQKIEDFKNKVIEGDCLEIMEKIPDKSVDMILCDLPYGTTQNEWDSLIPLSKLWKQYERIIKDRGAIVLTSQGIFTYKLIASNEKLFKYKMVWIKSKATNFLNAKVQPLRKHEDICVFYKKQHQLIIHKRQSEKHLIKVLEKTNIQVLMDYLKQEMFKSNGERYPSDIVYFKTAESEGEVYHPTQKPVALGRYLIKTFTKQGDIVLDNTCGSGSFLVSAVLEGRDYIGIELNKENVLIINIK
jgi:DNA modification methylase